MAAPLSREDVKRRLSGNFGQSNSRSSGLPATSRHATNRDIDPDTLAPVVSWEEFDEHFDWKQGEHVAAIGPTGSGKTTLMLHLLDMRRYVTALATKPEDATLMSLRKQGYKLMKEWKSYDPDIVPKRLLWPPAKQLYSAQKQRFVFQEAFDNIYPQGGWCIYVDELWYVIHHLKLDLEIRTFLMQARSMDISLVVCTQRPSRVPLEVYDQSTHLFFWQDSDEANLKRLGGISWANSWHVQRLVATLDKYQVLSINTRTGKMVRVTPPPPDGDE